MENIKIIIVDDPANRFVLQELVEVNLRGLNSSGNIYNFGSGKEVLEKIPELGKINLLFTNLVRQEITNGYELIRELNSGKVQRPKKIIIITGYGKSELDKNDIHDSEYDFLIKKPYTLKQIEGVLKETLLQIV